MISTKLLARLAAPFLVSAATSWPDEARAEDGYDLWLRYRPLETKAWAAIEPHTRVIVTGVETPTLSAARSELQRGLGGMLRRTINVSNSAIDGAIIIGTEGSLPALAKLKLPLDKLGAEGFLIRTMVADGKRVTVIAGKQDVGVLYGVFALLRRIQTERWSEAMRASHCGIGTSCRTGGTRVTPTMPGPTHRSESTRLS
jgi:alpha-glucuronidase